MKTWKHGLAGFLAGSLAFGTAALAGDDGEWHGYAHDQRSRGPLVEAVRAATREFRDVQLAGSAGYQSMGACVNSGGDEGAMGVHYVSLDALGDHDILDLSHPEALMYEESKGRARLLGVEYILFAADWDEDHPHGEAPALMGQLFDYIPAPNRYRLPAVYVLHVWAWKDNPNGTFSNWNPRVSCDGYAGGTTQ